MTNGIIQMSVGFLLVMEQVQAVEYMNLLYSTVSFGVVLRR